LCTICFCSFAIPQNIAAAMMRLGLMFSLAYGAIATKPVLELFFGSG